ncbi:MAG TPA: Hsp20/alpha crystallin family protein [Chthoniobacterales bacterium]
MQFRAFSSASAATLLPVIFGTHLRLDHAPSLRRSGPHARFTTLGVTTLKNFTDNYLRSTIFHPSDVACQPLYFSALIATIYQKGHHMMSLIRYQAPEISTWPSFDRWANLRDEMNRLFDLPAMGNLAHQSQLFSGWTPALDLYQTNDNIVAVVEIPGMKKEEIDISLHDGMLTIAGERATSTGEGENAERTERFSGKFRRSISLPTRVDAGKVSASYKDGILTVTLPKAEEAKPKKVAVNVE